MDKNRMKEWLKNEKPQGLSQKHIIHIHPELNEFLLNNYPLDISYKEKIYWFLNDITKHPLCACGNRVNFRNITYGYNECCCPSCSNSNPNRYEKIKKTIKERYGDSHYNNREKCKQTCLEKYGVENPFQAESIKNKIKETNIKKYNVYYPSQSPKIQNTRRINTLKKYGVDHHSKLDSVKKKILAKNYKKYIQKDDELIGYTLEGLQIRKCPHLGCNLCSPKTYIISADQKFSRKTFNIEPCTNILPIQYSRNKGSEIEKFICNILDEYNIEYQNNVRNIIPPQELDIYIPSKRLAIECNGVFWHSQNNRKDKHYHENKWKLCSDLNIQLLTIWEDQIKTKPKIVKSIILSKLGIYQERIYARKCQIIEPDSLTNFLEHNHIQGKTNSTIKIGLQYQNKLMSVMAFSKRSKLSGGKNDDCWELTRFCSVLNTQVIGAAGKLLKHFIKKYTPQRIVSFASNDISNGELYRKLGFQQKEETGAYWYISKKNWTRYHRTSFTKTRLKQLGFDIEGKTESEIMSELPFYKIYDSGHIKYELNLY